MQPELFPDPVLKRSLPKQQKTFIPTLPDREERRKFVDRFLSDCAAYGHCESYGIITALCCLYEDVETYSKEQFLIDVQPYL